MDPSTSNPSSNSSVFFVWPGCSGSSPRPTTVSQRRDSDSPLGLRPLPHPCGKLTRSAHGFSPNLTTIYFSVSAISGLGCPD
jgi:hypothetical protein